MTDLMRTSSCVIRGLPIIVVVTALTLSAPAPLGAQGPVATPATTMDTARARATVPETGAEGMSRRALVVAIVLCATIGKVQAAGEPETTVSDIAAQIVRGDILCSDFEQEKHIQALARPLLSSGKIIFVAGQGVLWQVLTPFPARLLVKSDQLVRWDADGNVQKTGYGRTPTFRALSSVFRAMFRGDFEGLKDTFALSATGAEGAWHLTMAPRDEALASAVSEVRVAGGRHVEEITILEPRGDQILIRFHNTRIGNCKLEDVEKTYFAR